MTRYQGLGNPPTARLTKALLTGVAVWTLGVGAAHAQQTAQSQQATTKPPAKSQELDEIVVTAQRKTERLQDVPVAVQALSGETLQELGVQNFDDIVKTLPGVTQAGAGPGQSEIYVRGLALGGFGRGQGSGAAAPFPNVAVYLDDQSAQVPGRNLDVYSADLERVEVLEGPQGTLFGSGAEAGVVRYITHKPDLDKTEAIVDADVAATVHGALSEGGDATLNLPLIDNTAALRLVFYDDHRGGYIDNVAGTFVRKSTDIGIHYGGYTNNIPGPPNTRNSANNSSQTGSDINPVDYQGFRLTGLWKFNDDWDVILSESVQDMDAEGVFYETPNGVNGNKLPDLSVQLFNPSYDKDNFENSALTIDGRIGVLSVVYSGSYLIRDTNQQQDYTNYARGVYADYYQCLSPAQAAKIGAASGCYSPSAVWKEKEHDTHLSQELRVKTPDDWRLRGTAGIFYEDFQIDTNTEFEYKTAPGFTPIAPPAGSVANNPGIRDANDAFLNDITRGYTQKAAYLSGEFDIIPQELTIAGGVRYYDFDDTEQGSYSGSFGCFDAGPAPCATGNHNIVDGHSTYTGLIGRANLTWKVTPDALVYYTWSQGFRPGGFNRGTISVHGLEFFKYAPDTLTNNEIGFKTEWLNRRLTLNGAIYQEEWDNVQSSVFNPGYYGILTVVTNGPSFKVNGGELNATAKVTDSLTLYASGEINSSEQTTSPALIGAGGKTDPALPPPFAPVGSSLAQSPTFKGSFRAREEWEYGDYVPFVQLGINGQTSTHSGIGAPQTGALSVYNTNFPEKGYIMADASAGISKGPWSLSAYCENCTNERSQEFISEGQLVKGIFVARPLTAGVRLRYEFQ
jgi:outer membrane receptor protein involved in Fe transport